MHDTVSRATEADVDAVASLWHDGWHDAHAELVPRSLSELRTPETFRERTRRHLKRVRVIRRDDARVVGLRITKGDELFQLYVGARARGTGAALALMHDAEGRLRARGVRRAWLACAIGNERAARFYRKCGWRLAGAVLDELETLDGAFTLEVWRFEKALSGPPET